MLDEKPAESDVGMITRDYPDPRIAAEMDKVLRLVAAVRLMRERTEVVITQTRLAVELSHRLLAASRADYPRIVRPSWNPPRAN